MQSLLQSTSHKTKEQNGARPNHFKDSNINERMLMRRATVSISDKVVEYINKWRAKSLLRGVDKSFSKCVNEMLQEMVRISNDRKDKKQTVYVVWYDDDYGKFASESRIIDGVFDSKIKAEQSVAERLKQFYDEYPHLKERTPYDIQEWDVY